MTPIDSVDISKALAKIDYANSIIDDIEAAMLK